MRRVAIAVRPILSVDSCFQLCSDIRLIFSSEGRKDSIVDLVPSILILVIGDHWHVLKHYN
jgi:hypothetical protein